MVLFDLLHDWGNLWSAYRNAARGKRRGTQIALFEYRLADNLLALQNGLQNETYQPGTYHNFYIHEPKRRLISAAPFRDRVVHHALCQLTTPFFESHFIPDSYANRRGKGTHRALDRCQEFARRHRYVLQCDVVQFFPSIDHKILRQLITDMLPDDSLSWLIDRILESGQSVLDKEYSMVFFPGDDLLAVLRPRGLPIGNLTSQWWANCYLNPLDQFIKRQLRCHAYLRYVDDFLLFAEDKTQLWEWRQAIIERLCRYRLTIHEGRAHPRPVTEGIPFLGFIVFPDYRLLKQRKGLSYRRKLRRMVSEGNQERVRVSVRGWINHARYGDTYGLRRVLLKQFDLLALEVSDG